MTGRAAHDRSTSGLTLLEVLAAAMIFAMVMTVLIGTSSTAVHHVGVSARRLEANELADYILADLEIGMKLGLTPDFDDAGIEQELFAIRTSKTDFLAGDGGGPGAALAGLGGGDASKSGDIASVLGVGLPEVAKHLKRYDIEVSWIEQAGPQSVTRTTFAFDWQAASEEFADLFSPGGGGGTSLSSNGNDNDDGDTQTTGRSNLVRTGLATEAEKATLRERAARRARCSGHNARDAALGCQ